jgi:hypothetical protein
MFQPSGLPAMLFHASGYLSSTVVMPGFLHTHELVEWDITENNRWLYAGVDQNAVTTIGIGSALEKKWNLHRFHYEGDQLLIQFDKSPAIPYLYDLYDLDLWLYRLRPKVAQGWVPVENTHNRMEGEWKTQARIPISSVVKIDVEQWLQANFSSIELESV